MELSVDQILGAGSYAEARAAADDTKVFIARLTKEERMCVIQYVMEGFCLRCGKAIDHPSPCYDCSP